MRKILLLLLISIFTLSQAKTIEEYKLLTSDGTILDANMTEKGFEFKGMKDRAVFLVIFGINCPPCLKEIPSFVKAVDKYEDNLSIIAIEAQGYTTEQLAKFKEKEGINYTLLSKEEKENEYLFSNIAQELNWKGHLPFFIGIDKYGEIKEVEIGEITHDDIEKFVDELNKDTH